MRNHEPQIEPLAILFMFSIRRRNGRPIGAHRGQGGAANVRHYGTAHQRHGAVAQGARRRPDGRHESSDE